MVSIDILICEDERLIALDLRSSLSKMGHNVVAVCHTAGELIGKTKSLEPDLILTDISLKGDLSGIDAINIIKQWKQIPFIYISGLKDETTYNLAMETDPCAFITKPYNYGELKSAIENCIGIILNENKQNQLKL